MESSLSFLFASHYPRLGAEETANQEMLMVSDQKKSQQKDSERGSLQRQKLSENNSSIPAKHHRKTTGHTSTQASKELDFHPSKTGMKCPKPASGWHSRCQARGQDSLPLQPVMSSHPVSGDHLRLLDFHHHLQ